MSQFNRRSFFGFTPLAALAFLVGKRPKRSAGRPVEAIDPAEHQDTPEFHRISEYCIGVSDPGDLELGMTVGIGDEVYRIHEIRGPLLYLETA